MSGFLYYFPHQSGLKVPEETLRSLGLLEVIGTSLSAFQVDGGPDGGNGLMAYIENEAKPRAHYAPDGQEWRKCAKGAFWLGFEKDAPPDANDLKRAIFTGNIAETYAVDLRDGEQWNVPTCKALPSYVGLDDEGEPVEQLDPRFQPLQAVADKAFRAYQYETGRITEKAEFELKEQYRLALAVLGLNYHLGKWEADTLKLMSDRNCFRVMVCFLDIPALARRQASADEAKKNEESASI